MKYHDCHIIVVDAVVVDWGLEQVRVLLEPGDLLERYFEGKGLYTILADSVDFRSCLVI